MRSSHSAPMRPDLFLTAYFPNIILVFIDRMVRFEGNSEFLLQFPNCPGVSCNLAIPCQ